ACIVDFTMATAMTGENSSYSNLAFKVKLTEEEYGIASRKNSNLNDEINRCMAELIKDGTLDTLAKKYNLTLIKK
ncbi:MAG: transporter substrate-binding domain-containing protein, partial [Oscillospiraceae bacterium]